MPKNDRFRIRFSLFIALSLLLASCSQEFTVSVNDQAVYDPSGRLITDEVVDADLQGCINLALRQQNLSSPIELTVLSCANSEIRSLENIGRLVQLRFLDLGNNNISNITPLEDLQVLGGLNLLNNAVLDIAPLLNMPGLVSVNLGGNEQVPCVQLDQLAARVGENLTRPRNCRN